jgi:hypothetical protein
MGTMLTPRHCDMRVSSSPLITVKLIKEAIVTSRHAGEGKMEKRLLGPCNYYCGNCVVHRKRKCMGCADMSEKAKKEGRVFCDISLCARDKQLLTCSDCLEYPCQKYDDGIFSASFIKWIRDKLKKEEES